MQIVVHPTSLRDLEKEAFSQGVSERALMENAGTGVADYTQRLVTENKLDSSVLLLVGKGNNGGDAFVAGRHLLTLGYVVHAILLQNELSPLCAEQRDAFVRSGGALFPLDHVEKSIQRYGIILDGLFGTGFSGALTGDLKKLVQIANHSGVPIIAIDIPSGLNGETGQVDSIAIQATVTLTLTAPKIGFYLDQGWNYVGNIETIPIGLPEKYLQKLKNEMTVLEREDLPQLLPPIVRNRHKYQRGHVVIMAGSPGMTGSAFLSATGAFRGGAGYVHLLIRDGMEHAYHNLPELITKNMSHMENDEILELINSASACVVGPGFGREDADQKLLREIIPYIEVPTVLDADALYLLAQQEIALPEIALLTPHHGEMSRLLHLPKTPPFSLDFLQKTLNYAQESKVHILLKGSPTFYIAPSTIPMIIPFGDPGMATAGSGDLLSGVLASLLSQKLDLTQSSLLGASLCGIAGELAHKDVTSYSMKTLDIAECIPHSYQSIIYHL